MCNEDTVSLLGEDVREVEMNLYAPRQLDTKHSSSIQERQSRLNYLNKLTAFNI